MSHEGWGELRSACHAKQWVEVDRILDSWDVGTRKDARVYAKEHGYKPLFARLALMTAELATKGVAVAAAGIEVQRQYDEAFKRIMGEG